MSVTGPKIVGRGGFPRDVVGESYYQDALLQIVGGYSRDGHHLPCVARVIPEPENPHDANAVRIEIEDMLVGRLSREDAEKFTASLAKLGRAGQSLYCDAQITGGWKTNQHDVGSFGVALAMPWPLRIED